MGTGKTTRLVDRAIQDFFNNGVCYLYESHRSNKREDHSQALIILLRRLNNEHRARYTRTWGCFDDIWCYKIEQHDL